MDLLQLYENDSEEESDSLRQDNLKAINILNKDKGSTATTVLHQDYFSLQDSDDEDTRSPQTHTPIPLQCKSKTVKINEMEIELPQSSFWMDSNVPTKYDAFENAESKESSVVSAAKKTICENTTDIEIIKSTNSSKCILASTNQSEFKPVPNQTSKYIQANSILESSPFYSTMNGQNKRLKRAADIEINEIKISKNKQISSADSCIHKKSSWLHSNDNMKRKIFFVHGKLASSLNKCVNNKCPNKVEKEWCAHGQVINRICWNQSQYSHLVLSASMDSTVKVWNVWSSLDACVQTLTSHDKAVKDAVWDPSGRNILSCGYDRSCILSCVESGTTVKRLDHTDYVFCCKYHPCNPNVVITGSSNNISVWDIRLPSGPTVKYRYKDKLGQIQDLVVSHDGDTVFTCSDMVTQNSADRNIMAWDYRTSCVLSNQIYEERYACNRLKLQPQQDSLNFLAQSQGGYIAIFSTKRPFKMNKSKRFEGHKLMGRNIGFDVSIDGDIVITGSCDKRLCCYSYTTGRMFKTLETGLDYTDVACHPVLPSTVLTAGWGGQLQLLH